MKFDRLLLEDYMQTPDGVRVMSFFKGFRGAFKSRFKNRGFYEFVGSLMTIDYARSYFQSDNDQWITLNKVGCSNCDEFESTYRQEFDSEQQAREFQGYVPKFSADLYLMHSEYAFPYLFPENFHKMKSILEMLGIAVPTIPPSRCHEERFNYYFELCRALHDFRIDHELTPLEMCVLVYGFAVRFVKAEIDLAAGEANRVYIVGATQADAEDDFLRRPKQDDIGCWQGSEEMLPGDIVIMYETSPYSRIGSIWRAVSPGFDDPFNYYPGKVFLGRPIKVPYVTIKELKSDPVWSRKGLVKASMQGVNGKVCTVDEYEALKKMFKRNDPKFDISRVPTPPTYARFYHEELKVERDVEEQLLEPLLKKIGFSKWVRQLPLRMGRGDRVFPDYALGVRGTGDDAAADFIWEAKYRIPTAKQLKIDFGQAKSYGLRLQSRAIGLIAMEGIWYATAADGFRFDKLRHFTWEQLQKPETIAELRQTFS